jgi:hypothetical protein
VGIRHPNIIEYEILTPGAPHPNNGLPWPASTSLTTTILAAAEPMVRKTRCWRKPDSNHWYRVMRSRFRERLMLPPPDFPPPEKSALTGDENAGASRGTDGSNPVPSTRESGEIGGSSRSVAHRYL